MGSALWLLACVSPVLCCIWQPLRDAMLNSLQTAAQDFFTWARSRIVGEFNSRRRAVVEVPVSSASISGGEETLLEIRNHLDDVSVSVIGIYGMGGVGKTTILQRINNDLFRSGTRGKFDVVIWVTVSKDINIPKIQKQIGKRLSLSFDESESSVSPTLVEDQANLLFEALSKKHFLLLLDDVWAKIDLLKVGIPLSKGRENCKLVFTTRSLAVCSDMGADKNVKVKLLTESQSWELFCSELRTGIILNNPAVRGLAEQVVGRCGGLPLALITVGRAMANRTLPSDWQHAVTALDHSAERLRGMDEVLSCLKFSYDYLENDKLRSALLYCAMYPEDTDIKRDQLIDYWVGEELLDAYDNIDHSRDSGNDLITNLQHACLLEAGVEDTELTVRMHDAVRDMVLWLNSHEYDTVHGFLVLTTENMTQTVAEARRGNHVRRIWGSGFDLELSPRIPNCPNTWTLLLNRAKFRGDSLRGFFNIMTTLRVLDLSDNRVLSVRAGQPYKTEPASVE